MRSLANALTICQCIWTCQTVSLLFWNQLHLIWNFVFRLLSLLKSEWVIFLSEIPTSQLLITDSMAVCTGSDTEPGLQLFQRAGTMESQHCFHSSLPEGQFVTSRIVSYKTSLKCQLPDKDRNYILNISGKKIRDPAQQLPVFLISLLRLLRGFLYNVGSRIRCKIYVVN